MEETKSAGEKLNLARVSKPELMVAYKELLKKYQEAASALPPAGQQVLAKQANQYKAAAEITDAVNGLKAAVDAVLREIELKLNAKFQESKQFDEQILNQQTRLKDLYTIEGEASALWAILEAKSEAKRLADIETQETSQKRKRDEEDYRFNLELQKRKDKESADIEKKRVDSELEAKKAEFIQKERDLEQKQAEFETLKKQAQDFPVLLEKEKQLLEARLRAEAKTDKDTAMLIARKDFEAQRSVLEARAINLEANVAEQKSINDSLREQLRAAQMQVQEVVLKSIEGASGAKTLEAVNKLAHEQIRSNNPNSQKPRF